MNPAQVAGMMVLAGFDRISRQRLNRTPEPSAVMDDAEQVSAFDSGSAAALDPCYCAVAELIHMALPQASALEALDLGCASGRGTLRIAEALNLRHVRALDLSSRMILKARENLAGSSLKGRVDFEVKDILTLGDIPDSSYGLTMCLNTAHQFESSASIGMLLKEMDRLTRPRGLALLADLVRPKNEALAGFYVEILSAGQADIFKRDYFNSLKAACTVEEMRFLMPASPGPWIHFTDGPLPLVQMVMRPPTSRPSASDPLWDQSPTPACTDLQWRLWMRKLRGDCLRAQLRL